MSDLQISLIVLGVIAIIGVVAYNKWKEIRARKIVNKALPQRNEDPLMYARYEPSSEQDVGDATQIDNKVEPSVEPSVDTTTTHEDTSQVNNRYQDASDPQNDDVVNVIDETIEYAIKMELDYPSLGEHLLVYVQKLYDIKDYQVRLLGLPLGDESNTNWEALNIQKQYTHLCLSILLADRRGPIAEEVLEKFLEHAQQIAQSTHASFAWPDMQQKQVILKRASYLAQFIRDRDAKLGVSLCTRGRPWEKAELYGILKSKGCVIREDGRIEILDPRVLPRQTLPINESIISKAVLTNKPLFTIELAEKQSQVKISRLTVFLDVMQFAASDDFFNLLVSFAHELCLSLNAKLVDDNNTELTEQMITVIDQEVLSFCEQMQKMSVSPGSLRAKRIFNP